ncbi:squalene synthase HpnC [Streptomyces nitrosporeus]|uniref:Squalene synthase HpnC n=1 Tax=Streptomyces nitrosporeus TaxID=28894 RepID=A0A5J6F3M8_9ACTN|nr:squalene synthase HpnC [Streptomyces nitrosporeus]QEU70929.1 squalene synthase HpnC [Streptomyces nitrosporeus]GGZ20694.1 phytoene synthase [Streptomyces nitrosporeus]
MTRVPRARTGAATLDKAADENFPVAPFFLPRAWRDDLMAVYGFARLVDDIGDGDLAPGGADARHLGVDPAQADDRLAVLDAFETDLHRVFATAGDGPHHPLLRALRPTVRRRALTPDPFLALVEANRQDQKVRRYGTYEELQAYCELSANPVGRLVLAITGTTSPERVRRSDAVCTALQIVEHLQDVAEDLARDRIYLPAEDMARFHVAEDDLAQASAGASVRALIAFEAQRAHALLAEGTALVGSVDGRLRLLLAGFVGGGRAALAAVTAAGHDVLPGPPKPTAPRLLREVGAVLRRAHRER